MHRPWRAAWQDALYAEGGFYRSPDRGARHDFSTAATRSPQLAAALVELLLRLLAQLGVLADDGRVGAYQVVDLGAGDGRLLSDLSDALPPAVTDAGTFTAVELGRRPATLATHIGWQPEQPPVTAGLLIAHEWLDTVPADVVEVDAAGRARLVEVAPDGAERLGDPVPDTRWLDAWWPLSTPGQRAEDGSTRTTAWTGARARVRQGAAVAIDYAHHVDDRPAGGSLTAYRRGREVRPVPDGSCDLTAHVALDACAAPGDLLLSQRDALAALSTRPRMATGLAALRQAGELAVLRDRRGLGAFGWLVSPTAGVDAGALLRPATLLDIAR